MFEIIKRLLWKYRKGGYSDRDREYWDLSAKLNPYQSICINVKTRKAFDSKRESILFDSDLKLDRSMIVLDLCCGLGRVGSFLVDQIALYVGIDYSQEMIKKARKRFRKVHNAKFFKNDGWTLSMIPDDYCDVVFCELGFQHMAKANTSSYVLEVHRILKTNGVFLAQIPRIDFYKDEIYGFDLEETEFLFRDYSRFRLIEHQRDYAYYLVEARK